MSRFAARGGSKQRHRIAWTLTLLATACGTPTPQPVAHSSTIALSADESFLVVTSPDEDALILVDASDGAERARIAVPGRPEQLAWVSPNLVAVTLDGVGALTWVELDTARTTQLALPCGSSRAVVAADRMFVSCPRDDRIVEVDPIERRVVGWRHVPGAPSSLALFGDTLGVALSRGGALMTLALTTGVPLEDSPATQSELETSVGHAASQADALAADPIGGFSLAFQRVEHDGDRDRDPASGGYGSVVDGDPRIEARLHSACGGRYVRFDGGALAMSGPSAIAIGSGLLWIAHMYTDGVVLAECAPSSDAPSGDPLRVLTTYRVGRAPRGIALSGDGRTAFVDNAFDWAVTRLDAPASSSARSEVTWTRRRTRGPVAMSDLALRGRSLFFDAVDTHLTPSGVVTCGTCHPRGEEDGLRWFLHTRGVARKLRRTPPAWGARAAMAPFHWDGEFDDGAALARATTQELMQGDGLLIDFAAIAAYMAEAPLPSPRAADDPSAAERGLMLWQSAGCESCHSPPLFADGALHSVLPIGSDVDAQLSSVSTPSLVGVRARAPFFHDGRAPTLADTVTVIDDLHGSTSALNAAQVADLVAYLMTL